MSLVVLFVHTKIEFTHFILIFCRDNMFVCASIDMTLTTQAATMVTPFLLLHANFEQSSLQSQPLFSEVNKEQTFCPSTWAAEYLLSCTNLEVATSNLPNHNVI